MAETAHRPTSVVVGTDGSESAVFAARHAAGLARAEGATLHLVSAYPSGVDGGPMRARLALEHTERALADTGCTMTLHRVDGEPATVLTEFAKKVDAALVVVGNRGTSSLNPWSRAVYQDVERRAHCPVVVVDTEPYWHVRNTERQPRIPRHIKVLLACMLAVFMSLLDVTIVNVAFPAIERDFRHTPVSDLSWVLNAYNIALAALLVPAGRLADRRGRRAVFYASVYLFVIGSVLCAAAPNSDLLIAARIVQAIGAAGLIPSSLGLLLPEFPAEKRAMAVSLWAAAGAVAAAAGPSLGGVLVDVGGWRWAFGVNVVLAIGFIPARHLLAERREQRDNDAPDALGGALLAVAVALIALGIVKAPEWGWTGDRTLTCWFAAAAVAGVLALHSRRHPSPVLEPALLGIRSFRVAAVTQMVYGCGFYALLLANVLFLSEVWHYSVLTAGFAITPAPLAAAVGAAVTGRIEDRIGVRTLVLVGTLGSATAMVLYRTLPGLTPHYAAHWLPCQLLSGVSAGIVFAALSTATVMDLPQDRTATGTALASCLRQIGAVFGIATLIAVLGTPAPAQVLGAFHRSYGLIALASVGAALVALKLPRRAALAIGEASEFTRRPVPDVPGLTTHETRLHGRRVVYRTAGDPSAPPVVLIHGLLDSGATWRKLAPILAVRHFVIVPDLPGHGDSDGESGMDYSVSGHARFVRDLLDLLGIDRSEVVGQSIGAAVALAYAVTWPERASTLTVISAGGIGREVSPVIRYMAVPGSEYVLRALGSRPVLFVAGGVSVIARALGLRRVSRAASDIALMLTQMANASLRGAFVQTVRAGVERRGQKATILWELGSSTVPLLVLWGENDRVIPARHASLVPPVRPDARIVLIAGVGHSPHHRQPAFVAEQILDWVSEHTPGRNLGAVGALREAETIGVRV